MSILRPRLGLLIATLTILCAYTAAESSERRASIKWIQIKPSKRIQIKILGLNKKQNTTLKSGFSTFSQLSIYKSFEEVSEEGESIAETSCTVKYDMWEEHYEVTLLADTPKTMLAKNLDNYLSHCLSVELYSGEFMNKFNKKGGTLVATLQVEQISSTQAQKVKAWLINQQSSVMRGLFSHMLGDMTLSQTSQIALQIPPPPANP
ncbi:MAG: hypothetical protein HRU09_11345 [Oligoflexales bacterium]|nr:hypothetical protein [Oligoflexales bacterium]